jgi:hypothetical protein
VCVTVGTGARVAMSAVGGVRVGTLTANLVGVAVGAFPHATLSKSKANIKQH